MPMPLDPIGNITLVLQTTILFLLIIGLPFARGTSGKKNLVRHGYLTVFAVALHTVLIFLVMLTSFVNGFEDIMQLSILPSMVVWSHIVLGTIAEILGVIIAGYWIATSPQRLMCGRVKKLMMPTFIIWIISLVNGSIVHIVGLI